MRSGMDFATDTRRNPIGIATQAVRHVGSTPDDNANPVPAAKPPNQLPRMRSALNAPLTRGRAARMQRIPANATKIIATISSRTPAHIQRRNVGTNIFVHTVVQPTTATKTVWNDPRGGNNRPRNLSFYIRCVISVCGAPPPPSPPLPYKQI